MPSTQTKTKTKATKSQSSSTKYEKVDKYELIVNKLLELMEQGKLPWRKEWNGNDSNAFRNLVTGHMYQGSNVLICLIDMMYCDYDQPYFVSFNQAEEMGWRVIKGSKATNIIWAGKGSKDVENEETGESEKRWYSTAKFYSVFNVKCIDDSKSEVKIADLIAKYQQPLISNNDRYEKCENFIKSTDAKIRYGGDRACFIPDLDTVLMPDLHAFTTSEAYYSTHFHELIHWSGHSSRLNRPLHNSKNSKDYAREELVAELGAVFISSEFNIASDLQNHANYLASWSELLKDDPKAFFKAAYLAQQASNFLLLDPNSSSELSI